jgi:hypothetical protein
MSLMTTFRHWLCVPGTQPAHDLAPVLDRLGGIDQKLEELRGPRPPLRRSVTVVAAILALVAIAGLVQGLRLSSHSSSTVSMATIKEEDLIAVQNEAIQAEVGVVQAQVAGDTAAAKRIQEIQKQAGVDVASAIKSVQAIDLGAALNDGTTGIFFISISSVFLGAIAGWVVLELTDRFRRRDG